MEMIVLFILLQNIVTLSIIVTDVPVSKAQMSCVQITGIWPLYHCDFLKNWFCGHSTFVLQSTNVMIWCVSRNCNCDVVLCRCIIPYLSPITRVCGMYRGGTPVSAYLTDVVESPSTQDWLHVDRPPATCLSHDSVSSIATIFLHGSHGSWKVLKNVKRKIRS